MIFSSQQDIDSKTNRQAILALLVVLFLFATLIFLWYESLSREQVLLDGLQVDQEEMYFVATLLNISAQQQALAHRLMTASNRDEIGKILDKIESKQKLLIFHYSDIRSYELATSEFEAVQNIDIAFDEIAQKIIRLRQLFQKNDLFALRESVSKEFSHRLDNLVRRLYVLLNAAHDKVNRMTLASQQRTTDVKQFVAPLTVIALLLIISIYIILRRNVKIEKQLSRQNERISSLYEISARPGLTFDEQIDETLRLGCRLFEMEIGKVAKRNEENNLLVFLNTVAPPDIPAKSGVTVPLEKTYCHVTFESAGPLAIHDVETSNYKDLPAVGFTHMKAYIGTKINVRGKVFGTISFSSRKPKKQAFSETDKDLVNLIGSWLSINFERKIAQKELSESKDIAIAANNEKSALLANISHEIRTPLTTIIGYSNILYTHSLPEEEWEKNLDIIINSSTHLLQLVNDVLDHSKLEAGQLDIEYIDFSPVKMVQELDDIFGAQARNKGLNFNISFDFPIPETINSDPTRLRQVLFNLCSNAIKFTEQGSILVSVKYKAENNIICFNIIDTGIGLSQQEQKKLFQPFSQADIKTTRKYGGTGLGLYISQQLVLKMAGTIDIQSTKGKGSNFQLQIDAGRISDTQTVAEPKKLNLQRSVFQCVQLTGKVLLAEDNIVNQALIKKYITKAGLLVDLVDNGQDAVKLASEEEYDLIIMDIQMPIMDGLQATKILRDQGYRNPIISLSANAMKKDRETSLAIGVNEYLTKPIDLARFYEVLERFLSKKESSKSQAKS